MYSQRLTKQFRLWLTACSSGSPRATFVGVIELAPCQIDPRRRCGRKAYEQESVRLAVADSGWRLSDRERVHRPTGDENAPRRQGRRLHGAGQVLVGGRGVPQRRQDRSEARRGEIQVSEGLR